MPFGLTRAQWSRFVNSSREVQREMLEQMSPTDALGLDADYEAWVHRAQLPPQSEGWRVWLMMAGRGFGKTRAGAEWIHSLAMSGSRRIALVAASIDEARNLMIEGMSGLLAVARNRRVKVQWEPSRGQLQWPSGSVAQLYSGDHPDGLRGPEHHFAWSLTLEVMADATSPGLGEVLNNASGGLIEASDNRPIAGFAAYGGSVRDSLAPLVEVAGVELVEGDGRLRTPPVEPPLSIDAEQLGCDADGISRSRIQRIRAREAALPARIALSYYDPARDYQTSQMQASSGRGGTREEHIELPAVLDAGEAKALAEQCLARRWRSADRLRLRLPPSAMEVRPGRSVRLAGAVGSWSIRAVSIEGMAVAIEAEAAAVGLPPPSADPGRSISEPDVPVGRTDLLLFELPAFGDGPTASIQAFAAGSNDGLWKPVLIEAALAASPLREITLGRRAVMGRTETALHPRSPLVMDELSSVDVELTTSAHVLLNADMDALAGGANLALIGEELVQFARAQQLGSGHYRLSHLLRGRRGTEWAATSHATVEAFCMIDQTSMFPLELPTSSMGAELICTSHGVGDVAPLPFAGRLLTGEALRPPSPCRLTVRRSGAGFAAEWLRRSYRQWHWIDGVGDVGDNFPELYRLTVTGPTSTTVLETSSPSQFLEPPIIPEESGQTITLSVASVGPSALSHPATTTIVT